MSEIVVKNQIPDMIERMKNLKIDDEKIGEMPIVMQKFNQDKNTRIVSLQSILERAKDKINDFEQN